jgi:hypothetical protein
MISKARLRISGLVRAQRKAEEALRQGLPPGEIQAFQAWAAGIVSQVEALCHQYQISPKDLPAPSRKAYQLLQSLNTPELSQLLAQNSEKKRKKPVAAVVEQNAEYGEVRLRNITRIIEDLHQMFNAIVQTMPAREADLQLATEPIRAKIQGHIQKIETICQTANSSPQRLPDPSLRAYQWLRFLDVENHLSLHLKSLYRAAAQVEALRPKFPARLRSLPIEVRYYNLPGLYRSQVIDGHLRLVANEAFIGAPQVVTENMLWAVLLPKQRQKEPLAAVCQYAASQAFSELAQKINREFFDEENERSRGRFHDLKAAFQRVNRQYFRNQLAPPRLVWGQRLSRRKLGHYQPATDTVQVSRTLDNPDVPGFVVDFIIYHELLHKHYGTQVSGGRRYSHTPDFKQAERRFTRFNEAQEFLNRLGKNLEL